MTLAAASAPALLRSSPTTNSSARFVWPASSKSRTAKIMAAMMPLVSQAPRPQMCWSSSREGKNGGTVSMCVESVTVGSPHQARTLLRRGSTGISSACPPCCAASSDRWAKSTLAHLLFVLGDGFDVHQRAREFENVHSIPINSREGWRKEGHADSLRASR